MTVGLQPKRELRQAQDENTRATGANRRVRRGLAALALVAAAGLVLWLFFGGGGEERREPSGRPAATAPIERRTLVDRETVNGTLGFAGSRSVVDRLAGGGSGGGTRGDGDRPGAGGQGSATLTWTARPGQVVSRGGVLYRLDNRPVFLMYGSVPAFRRLGPGVPDGPDVRQLEANLAALGFGSGVAVDDHFSTATAAAVKRWQHAQGLRQTGVVELGRVVLLRGARRIGSRRVSLGGAIGDGTEVMETTSARRVVKVELDVAKRSLVRTGDGVIVTLPDGSTARGRITAIGRVARAKNDGGDSAGGGGGEGGSDSGESIVDVTVELGSARELAGLDGAPVTVDIARETKRSVLAVPVAALLARRGGGYTVELIAGDRRRIVPVRVGLFAGGHVEISGRGLRPGQRVGVPSQ